jgi:5-methylcytosine-specific restriction endonuclease McrA
MNFNKYKQWFKTGDRMRKYSNDEVFVEHSFYARHHIKKRIIQDKLLEYKCEKCGNNGKHNNMPLSLQLDHRNGKSEDNRLENLRFLCPNCHSQTDTYAGKGSRGKRSKKLRPNTDFHENKLRSDKDLWNSLKHDESIRFGEWGWKTRLCKKIGIKSQKVTPWLRRVDPDFLEKYEK